MDSKDNKPPFKPPFHLGHEKNFVGLGDVVQEDTASEDPVSADDIVDSDLQEVFMNHDGVSQETTSDGRRSKLRSASSSSFTLRHADIQQEPSAGNNSIGKRFMPYLKGRDQHRPKSRTSPSSHGRHSSLSASSDEGELFLTQQEEEFLQRHSPLRFRERNTVKSAPNLLFNSIVEDEARIAEDEEREALRRSGATTNLFGHGTDQMSGGPNDLLGELGLIESQLQQHQQDYPSGVFFAIARSRSRTTSATRSTIFI